MFGNTPKEAELSGHPRNRQRKTAEAQGSSVIAVLMRPAHKVELWLASCLKCSALKKALLYSMAQWGLAAALSLAYSLLSQCPDVSTITNYHMNWESPFAPQNFSSGQPQVLKSPHQQPPSLAIERKLQTSLWGQFLWLFSNNQLFKGSVKPL